MLRLSLAFALLAAPALAQTPPSLQARVEAKLAEAPKGTRIGLVVADDTGREIVAVLPDQRFIPASNTKAVVTAAAFATLGDLTRPDPRLGTTARIEGGNVVLRGYGDARLSARPDCTVDCLATLADAIARQTRRVHDVIGDATYLPDQRWSPGMSWNNIPTESGTAASALTLDDNEVPFTVTPGRAGAAPAFTVGGYYTVENRATTAPGPATLDYDRLPFARTVRLFGTLPPDARPVAFRLGVDDPAHFAAWTFAEMLRARGVRVTGAVRALHRPVDLPAPGAPPLPGPDAVPGAVRVDPAPLAADVVTINKVSQNLHSELLLRRIAVAAGDGSLRAGLTAVHDVLARAGLPRTAYDFFDGSGMSTYNRISPRGMVTLLRWAAAQPWGKAWRDSFPVGGVDGTLAGRFKGTILEGRIFAKTGAINATAALSGYLLARSGRTLAFSILANDVPDGTSARPTMDAALAMIAEAN